jgi:hypothetical protein
MFNGWQTTATPHQQLQAEGSVDNPPRPITLVNFTNPAGFIGVWRDERLREVVLHGFGTSTEPFVVGKNGLALNNVPSDERLAA